MKPTRYEKVSRRAVLKASAGLGIAALLPSCGNDDVSVFAGARTDAVSAAPPADLVVPTTPPVTVEPEAQAVAPPEALPTPEPAAGNAATEAAPDPTAVPTTEPAPTAAEVAPDPTAEPALEPTTEAAPDPTAEPTAAPAPVASAVAVAGEMVISFTYTQAAGGKNERPYVAVWIENTAGELLQTVSLWYQQERRGERWLDHMLRWWDRDQIRIAGGGVNDTVTVSSATRDAGSYAVAWNGAIGGTPAAAGDYVLCIEAAREEGPYSLIVQPLALTGSLAETALPSNGELSAASMRISG